MTAITPVRCQRAFTLLEVIITLIVVGIVAAMMAPFLQTVVTRSVEPVISAQQHTYLNRVMENISSDFRKLSATQTNFLTQLQTIVGAEGSDMNNAYGTYRVITNHTVTFPSGSSVTETADANGNILKIKISYQGYTLTALFTK
jgi:prepilin-type N-terminal cleavage/methylation domain-containing protein